MKKEIVSLNAGPRQRRLAPILGATSMGVSVLATVAPFILNPSEARCEIALYMIAPVFGFVLAVASFIRREPAIWGVIGVIAAVFYVVLRCMHRPHQPELRTKPPHHTIPGGIAGSALQNAQGHQWACQALGLRTTQLE
jgi:hypothetical protein